MVAQTNHQMTKYAVENLHGKNLTRWFSGHHSRNSTIITTSGYKERNLSTLYQPKIEPLPQYPIGLVL